MIRGISLPGASEQLRICLYAGDTNLFISDTRSVHKILMLVELFELVLVAKLNREKTFGMWLGQFRDHSDQPASLNWIS